MKYFYLILCLIVTSVAFGQAAGDFQSNQTGNWDQTTTWERFDGASWVTPAPFTPTDADAVITILSGHTVTITADVIIDETTIQTGAVVVLNSGINLDFPIFLFNDALTIGGTFTNNGNFNLGIFSNVQVNGTFNANQGSTVNNDAPDYFFFNAGSTYDHRYTTSNGLIPLATWDNTSTCLISGYTTNFAAPGNLNQAFGNFTWSTSAFNSAGPNNFINLSGQLTTVNGDLRITSTGTAGRSLRFASIGEPGFNLTIGGSLRLDGGIVQFVVNTTSPTTINILGNYSQTLTNVVLTQTAGNITFNVAGNFSHTGGTLARLTSGIATFNFNGGTGVTQTYTYSGTNISSAVNFSIANASTLNIIAENFMMGTGTFTLQAGGTLGVASANGLVMGTLSGNIRVSGVRTYTANGNIIYNGTVAQNLGNEWGPGGALNGVTVNLEIANTNSAGVTNNIIGSTNLVGNLTLTSNPLNIGNSNTLIIQSNFITTGGTIGGSSTSNLTFSGSGALGTLTFAPGAQTLNNLTVGRTGTVVLGSNLTVEGIISLTSGNLNFTGHTLTMNGSSISSSGTGLISTSATNSNLIFGGFTYSGPVPFFGAGNTLETLTFSTPGGTFSWANNVTINTSMTLTAGALTHTSGLTMATNSTIFKGGGSISGSSPGAVTSYNVTYTGIGLTGLELPSSATALNNLTINSSGTVNLNSAITINGILTTSGGIFDAGTHAINMKGNFVSNSSSVLTSSPITFSGTTALSGTTVPVFGAITIAGTGTLNPLANFQINGNVVNNGILNLGPGTTTFGGTTTISGSATSAFNDIIISGTLTAPSGATFLISQGTFTDNGTFINNGSTVIFIGNSFIAGTSVPNFASISIVGTLTSPAILNVSRNFTNNGTFNEGTGTVVFNGSSAQSILGSTATNFHNISVTNTAAPVHVESNQNLIGVLTLSASSTFDADGTGNASIFTLVSTNDGEESSNTKTADAAIATLPTGASVTGSVTVQRYMSIEGPNNTRIYRFISSAVQNAPVSQIQATIPITGSFTGSSSCSGCGTAQSMFIYNEPIAGTLNDGYTDFPVNANTEVLATARGYSMFERGNVISSGLWSVRGVVNSGTINFPVFFTANNGVPDDGWNLVGNPYPSTIDWNAGSGWTKSADITSTIYMTDNGAGVIATWNGAIGSNGGSRYIPIGQAFFVKSNGPGAPSLIANENVKVGGTQSIFFRAADPSNLLRVALNQNGTRDEAVIHFREDATEGFDGQADAYKLKNSIFNLSSFSQDTKLAINSLPLLQCTRIVKLDVSNVQPGAYHFDFSNIQSFDPAIQILAHDAFAKNSDWIDLRGQSGLDFQVTTDSASFGSDRFVLSFGYDNQLPVALDVTADGVCGDNNSKITVNNTSTGLNYFAKINGEAVTAVTAGNGQSLLLTIDKTNLKQGDNTVSIVSQSPNCSTLTFSQDVFVKVDAIYSAKSNGGMNCREGSVTLTASGAPFNGSYNWYDKADATTPIVGQSGSQFLTPSLAKTGTYFVSAVNSVGCEGERIPVVATIVNYDDAAITIVDDKTLRSNYATGNHWYLDGQLLADTTASLTIRSSGLYALEVKIGGCTARDEKSLVVTGLGENGSGIRAYPNPVSGMYSLEIPAERSDIDDLPVFNTVGGQIGTMKLTRQGITKKGQFDFSSHSAGFYYIRAVSGSSITVIKVIKN